MKLDSTHDELKHLVVDINKMEDMANQLSKKSKFNDSLDRVFTYVREPYTGTKRFEGYGEHVILKSELI